MRLFLVLCVALAAIGAVRAEMDPDDVALMQIGVDLSTMGKVTPAPTYTTVKPAGHEETVIAKFPLLHELQDLDKSDWSDIQGLLFREPAVAAESNVDMKLDELEAKFNKIDTMPVPSPIAPKGSTLLPSLKKPEIGLRATLPPKMQNPPRMKQVKAAPKAAATQPTKTTPAAATPAPTKVPAPAAAAQPAAAKPAAAPAAKPAAAAAATPAAAAKPLSVDAQKAADAAKAKSETRVRSTLSTVRLIEKRLKGLTNLMNRLKGQMGITQEDKQSSAQRLTAALAKHRKEKKELAKRLANRKTRFAQVDLDADLAVEAEAEGELAAAERSLVEGASATETGLEADIAAETEADSEFELNADAEVVDEILDQLM